MNRIAGIRNIQGASGYLIFSIVDIFRFNWFWATHFQITIEAVEKSFEAGNQTGIGTVFVNFDMQIRLAFHFFTYIMRKEWIRSTAEISHKHTKHPVVLADDTGCRKNFLTVRPIHHFIIIKNIFLIQRQKINRNRNSIQVDQFLYKTQVQCRIACIIRTAKNNHGFFIFRNIFENDASAGLYCIFKCYLLLIGYIDCFNGFGFRHAEFLFHKGGNLLVQHPSEIPEM